MKINFKFVFLIISVLFFTCKQPVKQVDNFIFSAKVEIFYFHPTKRCAICNAVENNTQKLLAELFKNQIDKGNIRFTSFNFEEERNQEIVNKYQISFSSLLLIKRDSINEIKIDLTDKAFQYAQIKPAKYTEILKTEIEKLLKD